MEEERKNSIVIYCDWLPAIRKIPREDAGNLFIALLEYALTGEEPDFSGNLALDVLFTQYSILVSRDIEKYGKMHEYYDPETGEGVFNKGFSSWNALVANMIAYLENKEVIEEWHP